MLIVKKNNDYAESALPAGKVSLIVCFTVLRPSLKV